MGRCHRSAPPGASREDILPDFCDAWCLAAVHGYSACAARGFGVLLRTPAARACPHPELAMPQLAHRTPVTPLTRTIGIWLVLLTAALGTTRADNGKVTPDFVSLARRAMTTLPAPPPWSPTQAASTWTIDDIKAEFGKVTDNVPRITSMRTSLLRPEHAWFMDLNKWFVKVQKPLQIRFVDQLWDCDNYANCFVAFADVIALQGGETRGSFCIGWATVYYQVAFGGIRAGGGHAVVIVGTSKGLFVVEPQDGTLVPLAKFPNRSTIEEVFF
jgi:hypothetical protein